MPLALTPAEKIRRARALIAECRAMPEPAGKARGAWVVKMRSRLNHADKMLRPHRFRADLFSAVERADANTLRAEINALYPSVKH